MFNIPNVITSFIDARFSEPHEKIFCVHCERLRHGNDLDKEMHQRACHGASDGKVFIGYRIGRCLIARVSRGQNRGKWLILIDGGIICENEHFTGIKNSQIITISDISKKSNSPYLQNAVRSTVVS